MTSASAAAAGRLNPMTTAARQPVLPRWILPFLAAMAAVLTVLVGPSHASASTTSIAETRVGASTPVVEHVVGVAAHIGAGQRLGNSPPQAQVAVATGVAAKGGSGAASALSGAQLNRHLAQLEKYGSGGFKELESGRIRYYGDLTPAAKPGEMVGRRLVREWDPATDATRTWHETLDQSGNIRIVRPETGGPKVHYYFDEFGSFRGSW